MDHSKRSNQSSDLQTGDVVVLSTGGPRMTIERVNGDFVHCLWFVGDKLNGHMFELEHVRRVQ